MKNRISFFFPLVQLFDNDHRHDRFQNCVTLQVLVEVHDSYHYFSDILDDDSTEFLEALKRQMDGSNILNASPREVNILICM
jgi:hypothetical protein